jgi:hypothetical protein
MTLIDWLPAVSTTSALAFVMFLARNLIVTRLTNAVKHEYDKKLEEIRSDLKTKESELETLRNTALSGLSSRQSMLFQKQLEAAELLWKATIALSGGKPVSEMMFLVKIDVVSETIENDENMKEFFKFIGSNANIDKIRETNASLARPFVSKSAWLYYEAYSSIIWHYILQAKAFEHGLGKKYLKTKEMSELIKLALPHYGNFINEQGPHVVILLLDEIKDKILEEVQIMLEGKASDEANLKQASSLQELAKQLKAQQVIQPETAKSAVSG